MRQGVMNVVAIAIAGAGALSLHAERAWGQVVPVTEYCCVSGNGYECCGTSYCTANATSCSGVDKPGNG